MPVDPRHLLLTGAGPGVGASVVRRFGREGFRSTLISRGETVEQKLNKDYTLTIDKDLQQAVVDQLKGNHGAVVIFNPQTGKVLENAAEGPNPD